MLSGTFGSSSFTSSSAWFRAPFTMDMGFSFCRVLLRGAGVDMTKPQPVESALKLFGELLDEMEALLP